MIYTIEEYLKLADSENAEDNKKTIDEELSQNIIRCIINDYPERKSWLIHNKHISVETLRMLSTDNDVDVRFTIAMKKKCDREIFETFIMDPDFSVRMAVVRNNKLPLDLLKKMTEDNDIEISREATQTLEKRLS